MSSFSRILGLGLAFLLSGMLQPMSLLAQNAPAQQEPSATPSQTVQPPSNTATPDNSDQQSAPQQENEPLQQQQDKASQDLINGAQETGKQLPESPDTTRAREAAQQNAQKKAPIEPTGTAAAQEGALVGSTASRPAGAAIAPEKQHQVRSFLIKVGVIAGAGVALGTVYALSRASGSTPPGAR